MFKLTIFRKGLAIVAVPLLFQLGFVALVGWTGSRRENLTRAHSRALDVMEQAESVLSLLLDGQTASRGLVITMDPTLREPYDRAVRELPVRLQVLQSLVKDDPGQRELVDRIASRSQRLLNWCGETIRLAEDGASDEATARVGSREDELQMESLRRDMETCMQQQRLADAEAFAPWFLQDGMHWLLWLGTILSVVTTGLLGIAFTRSVCSRLDVLSENSRRLARGDELLALANGRDEISQVDRSFRNMAEDLAHSREAVRIYADIVKNVPLSLTIWRLDDPNDECSLRLVDANPAATRSLGLTMREHGGMTLPLVFPKVAEADLTSYADVVRSGTAKDMGEIFYYDERMAPGYWCVKAFPLPDRCVGIAFENVSERKRREDELRRTRERADAANQAKSEFLANMSHEIRTPLTGILGFTEVLRRGLGTEEQQEAYLDTIFTSGQHLLTLIDHILDLSKIEAKLLEFEYVDCSPHEIIADVLSILRVRAREKSLRLECVWRSGVPETIHTDPARVRQLLMNVVGNAVKFTETGGVHLEVTIDKDAPEPRFVIEVHDTGIGIPADRLERVFLPFDQLDASITRQYGGTGLGLAISRHIARGLGGDITVESELGQGSVFRILLKTGPLDGVRILDVAQTEAIRRSHRNHRYSQHSLVDARILLVEDGETNRDLIKLVLEEAGATVLCVEDGQKGLETALHAEFDVVLMDMQMPVMDGYEATRRLRKQLYEQPIIALTAHAMRGDKEKCLEAGCSGYLAKPIDVENLLQTVADALSEDGDVPEIMEEGGSVASKPLSPEASAIHSTLPMDRPEFRVIVERFHTKLFDKLDEMEAAIEQEDLKTLCELAHWLKGSGGTIGFDCFTEPARQLENLARKQQTSGLADGVRDLRSLAERITVES